MKTDILFDEELHYIQQSGTPLTTDNADFYNQLCQNFATASARARHYYQRTESLSSQSICYRLFSHLYHPPRYGVIAQCALPPQPNPSLDMPENSQFTTKNAGSSCLKLQTEHAMPIHRLQPQTRTTECLQTTLQLELNFTQLHSTTLSCFINLPHPQAVQLLTSLHTQLRQINIVSGEKHCTLAKSACQLIFPSPHTTVFSPLVALLEFPEQHHFFNITDIPTDFLNTSTPVQLLLQFNQQTSLPQLQQDSILCNCLPLTNTFISPAKPIPFYQLQIGELQIDSPHSKTKQRILTVAKLAFSTAYHTLAYSEHDFTCMAFFSPPKPIQLKIYGEIPEKLICHPQVHCLDLTAPEPHTTELRCENPQFCTATITLLTSLPTRLVPQTTNHHDLSHFLPCHFDTLDNNALKLLLNIHLQRAYQSSFYAKIRVLTFQRMSPDTPSDYDLCYRIQLHVPDSTMPLFLFCQQLHQSLQQLCHFTIPLTGHFFDQHQHIILTCTNH